jgi:hypothetical protein
VVASRAIAKRVLNSGRPASGRVPLAIMFPSQCEKLRDTASRAKTSVRF